MPFSISPTGITVAAKGSIGIAPGSAMAMKSPKATSTGTKDPVVSDVLYVKSLAAPHTVNTMPEKTLFALADHGDIGPLLPHDGGDAEDVLRQFTRAGFDLTALAATLQRDGAEAFARSWDELLVTLADRRARLRDAG
jgi:transaldolase